MASPCTNGSRKKQTAPESFTIDTGAICFLLGLDSPICALLDTIPSLVGQPWKQIIKGIASELFSIIVDQVTGQVNTADFCSLTRPSLPSEITYTDIFALFASYIPPLSFVVSADSILAKITAYYLYEKWNQYCECIPEEPPERDDSQPFPPFDGNRTAPCQAAEALQGYIDTVIEDQNASAALYGSVSGYWASFSNTVGINNEVTESVYNSFLNSNSTDPYYIISESPITNKRAAFRTQFRYLCLKMPAIIYPEWKEGKYYQVGSRTDLDFLGGFAIGTFRTGHQEITFDFSECCPPPPPPPPKIPDENDCVPVPPPDFCRLNPSSPLCTNVPPNPNGAEPIEIEVDDYICGQGFIKKNIGWIRQ